MFAYSIGTPSYMLNGNMLSTNWSGQIEEGLEVVERSALFDVDRRSRCEGDL